MLEEIVGWLSKWTIDNYMTIGLKIIKIILIWIAANILIRVGSFLIRSIFDSQARSRVSINKTKNETLKALTKSILRYTVYFIAVLMVLGELGVNTSSILATAGIGGLAIGFGAQSLVKDVISGFL